MKIAVVGGGINGLMIAMQLSLSGHTISVFEKNKLLEATSSSSTKLIHGGLRYLENFQFMLVRESLKEREFWLQFAPEIVKPIELLLPIYKNGYRKKWKYKIGLHCYDFLSGKRNLGKFKFLNKDQILSRDDSLVENDLSSGFLFFDAQMNDYKLGLFVAKKILDAGVSIIENKEVKKLFPNGNLLFVDGTMKSFDRVINAAGPWAQSLLNKSGIDTRYHLDLVRGSHIVFNQPIENSFLLEVPGEERMFFVISYSNKTLVGTTEVRQSIDDPIEPLEEELDYLINAYNFYFKNKKKNTDIEFSFSGVRPLIKTRSNTTQATRNYALEKHDKLISAFGGKWTTSRRLAQHVLKLI